MNNIKEISVQELNKKIQDNDNFILIDVRETYELKISKIAEAIHIPMNTISDNLNQLDSTKSVIIMCKSGGRSAQVCEYLKNQNYMNVYNLKGGIISWALEVDPNMETY